MQMGDEVRGPGGASFARGCVTEYGRFSWAAISAAISGQIGPRRLLRRIPASVPAEPLTEDHAIPPELVGTALGRVYGALLRMADENAGHAHTRTRVAELAEIACSNTSSAISGFLGRLEQFGHIRLIGWPETAVEILATGQIVRLVKGKAWRG